MSRPKFLPCIMTPNVIRSIRGEQEAFDRDPAAYENEQRMHEEQRRQDEQQEREAWRNENERQESDQ